MSKVRAIAFVTMSLSLLMFIPATEVQVAGIPILGAAGAEAQEPTNPPATCSPTVIAMNDCPPEVEEGEGEGGGGGGGGSVPDIPFGCDLDALEAAGDACIALAQARSPYAVFACWAYAVEVENCGGEPTSG